MENTLTILCIISAVLTNGCAFGQAPALPAQLVPHLWTANIKVIGEDNNPIGGAKVSISYTLPATATRSDNWGEIKGITDTNGIFSASHTDSSWGLGIMVEKSGYYSTEIGHQFYFDENRRHPSFTLVLKKIGHPIPMYARNAQIEIPVLDKPVGFDLEEYAWVAPYGNGKRSDIVFEARRQWVSRRDFDATVKITFPKSGDGLLAPSISPAQGSSGPQMPVTAPLDSYVSEHQVELSHKPTSGWKDGSKQQNYYLRIRTVLDPNGNVKSALYGKIYGGFTLDPINSKTTLILFTYYLNPTPNDWNTEFNPSRNLFTDLPIIQQVKAP